MGALAFAAFMFVLLCIGIFGIVSGIVGIILFKRERKKGKKISKVYIVISAIVLAFSVLICILPIGFAGFTYWVNTEPPENFVETEIVIEEDGYQDESFTADGVVYEFVEDFYLVDECYFSNPIFTYKTSGFMNGSRCGNYYKIENEHGFNIVAGEFGGVFCPVNEKEEIMEIYGNYEFYDWWLCDDNYDPHKKIGDKEQEIADKFYEIYKSEDNATVSVETAWEDSEEYLFECVSYDKLFLKDSMTIRKINSEYYLSYTTETNARDNLVMEGVKIEKSEAEKIIK